MLPFKKMQVVLRIRTPKNVVFLCSLPPPKTSYYLSEVCGLKYFVFKRNALLTHCTQ